MSRPITLVTLALLAGGAWFACGLSGAHAAGGGEAQPRVVEVRAYNLKPGSAARFEKLFFEEAKPLLERWGVDVVAFGRSLHDESSWYLIRSFDGVAHRETQEAAFYGSAEWHDGPREAILDCIESFTTVVLPFDAGTLERMRQTLLVLNEA